ncbi:MAG: hypothetical protein QME41_09765 [Actinomycetota bacterium]|nr:hypothetical protein [Actinomycetota bacterium]
MKEILLYGIPLWVGLPLTGWYFEGWLGLKSAIVGLFILGVYIASEILVEKKSRKISGSDAVALMVASFGIRLIVLLVVALLVNYYSDLNLLVLLLTVALGFTAMLFMSVKNWL